MVAGQEVARFLFQRIALGALVIVFASALTFFFVNLAPGGPGSIMRFDVTAEQREALIKAMGLDRPVPQRYIEWLSGAVRGDLGRSLLTDEPVAQRLLPSAGVTSVASDSLVDRLTHLVLPAFALATTILPTVVRFMRSATIEVLSEDYIRTAT